MCERHPQLGAGVCVGTQKVGSRDPDYGKGSEVQDEGVPENVLTPTEYGLPTRPGDDGSGLCPGSIVLGTQEATPVGLGPQDAEVLAGHGVQERHLGALVMADGGGIEPLNRCQVQSPGGSAARRTSPPPGSPRPSLRSARHEAQGAPYRTGGAPLGPASGPPRERRERRNSNQPPSGKPTPPVMFQARFLRSPKLSESKMLLIPTWYRASNQREMEDR